jgi:hypothetical protein
LCISGGIAKFGSRIVPVRNQFVERHRVDHGAGQDMRTDLGALLDHDNRQIGVELLQPDRRGEAGRSGADDHDVEFHGFAWRQFFGAHDLVSARLRTFPRVVCFWDGLFPIFASRTTMEIRSSAFRCGAVRSRMA